MGKERSNKIARKQRHDPLHAQMMSDMVVGGDGSAKRTTRTKRQDGSKSEATEEFVDAKLSKKILGIAQDQQREVEAESGPSARTGKQQRGGSSAKQASVFGSASFGPESDDDNDDNDHQVLNGGQPFETEADWDGGNDDILDVDANELAVLERFFPQQPATRQTLADIIAEKIATYEAETAARAEALAAGLPDPAIAAAAAAAAASAPQQDVLDFLNPKVVQVYTKVGKLLSRYKSGKLPKAFKIIPTLTHWEEVLYLTRPDEWTAHAMYEATKIFVSSFNPQMAQRFLNLFLLERVRDELAGSRKLNYHLYMALKKALYKPAAFFKGILLPLVEQGCSLREAAIVGSVVAKVSVPALHSAACMMKLADMEYSGAASLFMRVLLDKKYALPYKVVDAIVFHFLQFRPAASVTEENPLPVLWHQALLVFAQRYKSDITTEQRDALLSLIKVRNHYSITPEIRRELVNAVPRGTDTTMTAAAAQQPPAAPVAAAGFAGFSFSSGMGVQDVEMVDA